MAAEIPLTKGRWMKQALADLGWTLAEIEAMSVQEAYERFRSGQTKGKTGGVSPSGPLTADDVEAQLLTRPGASPGHIPTVRQVLDADDAEAVWSPGPRFLAPGQAYASGPTGPRPRGYERESATGPGFSGVLPREVLTPAQQRTANQPWFREAYHRLIDYGVAEAQAVEWVHQGYLTEDKFRHGFSGFLRDVVEPATGTAGYSKYRARDREFRREVRRLAKEDPEKAARLRINPNLGPDDQHGPVDPLTWQRQMPMAQALGTGQIAPLWETDVYGNRVLKPGFIQMEKQRSQREARGLLGSYLGTSAGTIARTDIEPKKLGKRVRSMGSHETEEMFTDPRAPGGIRSLMQRGAMMVGTPGVTHNAPLMTRPMRTIFSVEQLGIGGGQWLMDPGELGGGEGLAHGKRRTKTVRIPVGAMKREEIEAGLAASRGRISAPGEALEFLPGVRGIQNERWGYALEGYSLNPETKKTRGGQEYYEIKLGVREYAPLDSRSTRLKVGEGPGKGMIQMRSLRGIMEMLPDGTLRPTRAAMVANVNTWGGAAYSMAFATLSQMADLQRQRGAHPLGADELQRANAFRRSLGLAPVTAGQSVNEGLPATYGDLHPGVIRQLEENAPSLVKTFVWGGQRLSDESLAAYQAGGLVQEGSARQIRPGLQEATLQFHGIDAEAMFQTYVEYAPGKSTISQEQILELQRVNPHLLHELQQAGGNAREAYRSLAVANLLTGRPGLRASVEGLGEMADPAVRAELVRAVQGAEDFALSRKGDAAELDRGLAARKFFELASRGPLAHLYLRVGAAEGETSRERVMPQIAALTHFGAEDWLGEREESGLLQSAFDIYRMAASGTGGAALIGAMSRFGKAEGVITSGEGFMQKTEGLTIPAGRMMFAGKLNIAEGFAPNEFYDPLLAQQIRERRGLDPSDRRYLEADELPAVYAYGTPSITGGKQWERGMALVPLSREEAIERGWDPEQPGVPPTVAQALRRDDDGDNLMAFAEQHGIPLVRKPDGRIYDPQTGEHINPKVWMAEAQAAKGIGAGPLAAGAGTGLGTGKPYTQAEAAAVISGALHAARGYTLEELAARQTARRERQELIGPFYQLHRRMGAVSVSEAEQRFTEQFQEGSHGRAQRPEPLTEPFRLYQELATYGEAGWTYSREGKVSGEKPYARPLTFMQGLEGLNTATINTLARMYLPEAERAGAMERGDRPFISEDLIAAHYTRDPELQKRIAEGFRTGGEEGGREAMRAAYAQMGESFWTGGSHAADLMGGAFAVRMRRAKTRDAEGNVTGSTMRTEEQWVQAMQEQGTNPEVARRLLQKGYQQTSYLKRMGKFVTPDEYYTHAERLAALGTGGFQVSRLSNWLPGMIDAGGRVTRNAYRETMNVARYLMETGVGDRTEVEEMLRTMTPAERRAYAQEAGTYYRTKAEAGVTAEAFAAPRAAMPAAQATQTVAQATATAAKAAIPDAPDWMRTYLGSGKSLSFSQLNADPATQRGVGEVVRRLAGLTEGKAMAAIAGTAAGHDTTDVARLLEGVGTASGERLDVGRDLFADEGGRKLMANLTDVMGAPENWNEAQFGSAVHALALYGLGRARGWEGTARSSEGPYNLELPGGAVVGSSEGADIVGGESAAGGRAVLDIKSDYELGRHYAPQLSAAFRSGQAGVDAEGKPLAARVGVLQYSHKAFRSQGRLEAAMGEALGILGRGPGSAKELTPWTTEEIGQRYEALVAKQREVAGLAAAIGGSGGRYEGQMVMGGSWGSDITALGAIADSLGMVGAPPGGGPPRPPTPGTTQAQAEPPSGGGQPSGGGGGSGSSRVWGWKETYQYKPYVDNAALLTQRFQEAYEGWKVSRAAGTTTPGQIAWARDIAQKFRGASWALGGKVATNAPQLQKDVAAGVDQLAQMWAPLEGEVSVMEMMGEIGGGGQPMTQAQAEKARDATTALRGIVGPRGGAWNEHQDALQATIAELRKMPEAYKTLRKTVQDLSESGGSLNDEQKRLLEAGREQLKVWEKQYQPMAREYMAGTQEPGAGVDTEAGREAIALRGRLRDAGGRPLDWRERARVNRLEAYGRAALRPDEEWGDAPYGVRAAIEAGEMMRQQDAEAGMGLRRGPGGVRERARFADLGVGGIAGGLFRSVFSGWELMRLQRMWNLTGGPVFSEMIPEAAQTANAAWRASMNVYGYGGQAVVPGGVAGGMLQYQAQQQMARLAGGDVGYRSYGSFLIASQQMQGLRGLFGPAVGAGAMAGSAAGMIAAGIAPEMGIAAATTTYGLPVMLGVGALAAGIGIARGARSYAADNVTNALATYYNYGGTDSRAWPANFAQGVLQGFSGNRADLMRLGEQAAFTPIGQLPAAERSAAFSQAALMLARSRSGLWSTMSQEDIFAILQKEAPYNRFGEVSTERLGKGWAPGFEDVEAAAATGLLTSDFESYASALAGGPELTERIARAARGQTYPQMDAGRRLRFVMGLTQRSYQVETGQSTAEALVAAMEQAAITDNPNLVLTGNLSIAAGRVSSMARQSAGAWGQSLYSPMGRQFVAQMQQLADQGNLYGMDLLANAQPPAASVQAATGRDLSKYFASSFYQMQSPWYRERLQAIQGAGSAWGFSPSSRQGELITELYRQKLDQALVAAPGAPASQADMLAYEQRELAGSYAAQVYKDRGAAIGSEEGLLLKFEEKLRQGGVPAVERLARALSTGFMEQVGIRAGTMADEQLRVLAEKATGTTLEWSWFQSAAPRAVSQWQARGGGIGRKGTGLPQELAFWTALEQRGISGVAQDIIGQQMLGAGAVSQAMGIPAYLGGGYEIGLQQALSTGQMTPQQYQGIASFMGMAMNKTGYAALTGGFGGGTQGLWQGLLGQLGQYGIKVPMPTGPSPLQVSNGGLYGLNELALRNLQQQTTLGTGAWAFQQVTPFQGVQRQYNKETGRMETVQMKTPEGAPIMYGGGQSFQMGMYGNLEQARLDYSSWKQTTAISNKLADMSVASSMMSLVQSLESLELSFEKWAVNTEYQRREMGIQWGQMQVQQQWAREDVAYNRQVSGLQYQWSMEDYDLNIRFATGRQKKQLLRERGRAEEMYSIQEQRRGVEESRMETQFQWEEDRFARQKQHFETMAALEAETFEMQRRHIGERMAMLGAQAALQKELRQIEQDAMDRRKQYDLAQLEQGIKATETQYALSNAIAAANAQMDLWLTNIPAMTAALAAMNALLGNAPTGTLQGDVALPVNVPKTKKEDVLEAGVGAATTFSGIQEMMASVTDWVSSIGPEVLALFGEKGAANKGFKDAVTGVKTILTDTATWLEENYEGFEGLFGKEGLATKGIPAMVQSFKDAIKYQDQLVTAWVDDMSEGGALSDAWWNLKERIQAWLAGINFGGGGKAEGGSVRGGTTYLVGEEGPELFVPNQSGVIVPHDLTKMALAGAGGSTNNTSIHLGAGAVVINVPPGNYSAEELAEVVWEKFEQKANELATRQRRKGDAW